MAKLLSEDAGSGNFLLYFAADAGMMRRMETGFNLIHGDCVEGMSRLEANSVDVVVTSPPYNLGIKYGKYDDRQMRDGYLEWSATWAAQVNRALKDDGAF